MQWLERLHSIARREQRHGANPAGFTTREEAAHGGPQEEPPEGEEMDCCEDDKVESPEIEAMNSVPAPAKGSPEHEYNKSKLKDEWVRYTKTV